MWQQNTLDTSANQQVWQQNTLDASVNQQVWQQNTLGGSVSQQVWQQNTLEGSANQQVWQQNTLDASVSQQVWQQKKKLDASVNQQVWQREGKSGKRKTLGLSLVVSRRKDTDITTVSDSDDRGVGKQGVGMWVLRASARAAGHSTNEASRRHEVGHCGQSL